VSPPAGGRAIGSGRERGSPVRAVEVHLVDVFTSAPLAGNPAAVVPEAGGLDAATMRAVAAELGRPATAFVGPAPGSGADRGLRWFSATGAELSLCGHGTVAAAHVLAGRGEVPGGRLVFATSTRRLAVTVEGADRDRRAWFEPDCPRWIPATDDLGPLLETLGLGVPAVGTWAPPARTSERDLLVPVTGLDPLARVAADFGQLARALAERDLRGVCLVAREVREPGALTHSRFFAPGVGIPEDAATGSAHAAIGAWLWDTGNLPRDHGTASFRAEQGDFLGRPGRLAVEVDGVDGRATRVRVGGHAVTVLVATLRLA
jgi:PhzF family phenazine biosynthesis protein